MASQASFDPRPVTLQGKTVRLEPLTLDHGAGLLAAGAEESIWQFSLAHPPTSLDHAQEWIRNRLADQDAGRRIAFAVICLADGKFAGSSGYGAINQQHRTLEIGTWYGVDYQRTGVNTECKYLLLKHSFEELGARRVGLNVDLENIGPGGRWSVSAACKRVSCANNGSGAMALDGIRWSSVSLMMTGRRSSSKLRA